MTNLLDLAQQLVEIDSASRNEKAMADLVERLLRTAQHLEVTRIGDNVVARSQRGRTRRLIIAGHLDTVTTPGIQTRRDGDILFGLGSADMKGTLAVMLELARNVPETHVDVSWIFYAREEIARSQSGLLEIEQARPDLLQADAAILGEPTSAKAEAGCQGTVRVKITLAGKSAHTARPWMGLNAIHRMGLLLDDLSRLERRAVEIEGVAFQEQIEAVEVGGGHGGNSVPDSAWLTINIRVAPDRSTPEVITWLSAVLLSQHLTESADVMEILDAADGALPNLGDETIAELVAATGGKVTAKLGWTDVATFSALSIPAVNFGAGNPELAHHKDEHVTLGDLEEVYRVLKRVIS